MYPFSLPWCMCIPVKVGIPEFLNGVGKGVETHIPKLEAEIGEFQKLLVTRTLKLKKLGIPCKHVRVDLIFLLFMIQSDDVICYLAFSSPILFQSVYSCLGWGHAIVADTPKG